MEKNGGGQVEPSTDAALTLMLIYVSGEYRRLSKHLAAKLCLLAIEAAVGGPSKDAAVRKVLGSRAAERLRILEGIRRNGAIRSARVARRKKSQGE